jgi:hypothetical protein
MSATTIAQYYVEEEGVRIDLEIGLADIEAYKNLLPQKIYQQMGFGNSPWNERLQHFFERELSIVVNEKSLAGELLSIEPGQRVKRDEVTGEPIPVSAEDAEQVINASVFYSFHSLPKILSLVKYIPGARADVGFVLYHKGVAVNDFRYLSGGYQLELDWQDPWYSKFTTKNLKRRYSAPMSGFLYVEPFEVRKEVIVRPKDLQRWVDLGLEGREIIPAEMHADIIAKVAEFLAQHHPVSIDGVNKQGILDRVNFLERTLTSSRVIDPPQDLSIESAVIGAIFVYPTNGLPEAAEMTWDLWDERIQMVPASAVDEAGPLAQYLQPDWNVLRWENFLKNPTIPSMQVIQIPPSALAKVMVWLRWVFVILTLLAVVHVVKTAMQHKQFNKTSAGMTVAFSICTVVTISMAKPAVAFQSQEVVSGLLHNIYRAFDYREEGDIYDALDRSVTGDLLTDIYLETRRGLVLANQGGARAKVKTIELKTVDTQAEQDGFVAEATWVVTGSVGHWGHVHSRVNQYTAEMNIQPIDGVWKVIGMSVLQEERL